MEESVADARAWVLVMVIVSSAVPPALIVLGANALETVGGDALTESMSPAEQTPANVQEVDGLVLVTLTGGVMTATLLTEVWANALKLARFPKPSRKHANTNLVIQQKGCSDQRSSAVAEQEAPGFSNVYLNFLQERIQL
jgi:hypothetical protein